MTCKLSKVDEFCFWHYQTVLPTFAVFENLNRTFSWQHWLVMTSSVMTSTVSLFYQLQVQEEKRRGSPSWQLPREHWDTWDPMLIAEGLFAAANIFSNLKLVYIFSVNPYLGPLQVSLSRMVMDILKFLTLFVLVLFAFSCGEFFCEITVPLM